MKTCSNCKQNTDDNMNFCPNCGTPLAAPQPFAVQAEAAPVQEAAAAPVPTPQPAAYAQQPAYTSEAQQSHTPDGTHYNLSIQHTPNPQEAQFVAPTPPTNYAPPPQVQWQPQPGGYPPPPPKQKSKFAGFFGGLKDAVVDVAKNPKKMDEQALYAQRQPNPYAPQYTQGQGNYPPQQGQAAYPYAPQPVPGQQSAYPAPAPMQPQQNAYPAAPMQPQQSVYPPVQPQPHPAYTATQPQQYTQQPPPEAYVQPESMPAPAPEAVYAQPESMPAPQPQEENK